MLAKAMRLCEAAFGVLWSYDGKYFQAVATRGVSSAEFLEFLRGPQLPGPETALGRILAGEHLVHMEDQSDSDAYRIGSPLRRAFVDLGGARSGLVLGLRKDGALLGVFTIYRQEVRPFTKKQIRLVENFGAQAVIAIENARLLNELRDRTAELGESLDQQTATSEVLGVISSSPGELKPVFQAMLANATRLCEAHFGILYRYDGNVFHAVALQDVAPAFADHLRREPPRPSSGNALGRLLETKRPIHIADVKAEPAFLAVGTAAFELGGARTYLIVPMLKNEGLIGAISIYRQDVRPFTDKQIAFVTSFAAQAVIAIENARLLNELRESLEQQTATSEVLGV